MAKVGGFPLDLLSRPKEERLAYFQKYSVRHPVLQEMDARLWRAVHTEVGSPLILVYGPTGVGKTTLRGCIERRLQSGKTSHIETNGANGHHLPVVGVEAAAPDGGNFSWKDFYKHALFLVEEPFFGKDLARLPPVNRRLEHALSFNPRLPNCEYRASLTHALRHRKPAAFFIDEAQHLTRMASGRKLQDQMDVLKSLACSTHSRLVLVGTYELLALRNLSGQLSRRSVELHFRRYQTSRDDLHAFQNIVYSLQIHLPLVVEPDLMKHWEYLYARSIGCVGILKDWLMRALEELLEENARTLTLKMLERNALGVDQCETIAAEAIEGEGRVSYRGKSSARLMQMLGFTKTSASSLASATRNADNSSAPGVKIIPSLPSAVGRRKPRRDPVG